MKFCTHCGKELFDEAVICPGCGCPASNPAYNNAKTPAMYLQELSRKVKTEAIIWTVIASLQAFIGLIDLLFFDVTTGGIILVICALNFASAYNDFKYSKEVLDAPYGIIAKYEPITGLIISLIYNLIFGGIIGVVGTVFGFLTRSFVMENRQAFMKLAGQE